MLSVRDITTQTLSMGLTINNLNLWRRPDGSSVLVRHFEDQALRQTQYSTSAVRAKAQFRLRRELSRTIRPSLTPALRLGLVGTRPTGALALIAQQHEVVHVIYCQSLWLIHGWCSSDSYKWAHCWLSLYKLFKHNPSGIFETLYLLWGIRAHDSMYPSGLIWINPFPASLQLSISSSSPGKCIK